MIAPSTGTIAGRVEMPEAEWAGESAFFPISEAHFFGSDPMMGLQNAPIESDWEAGDVRQFVVSFSGADDELIAYLRQEGFALVRFGDGYALVEDARRFPGEPASAVLRRHPQVRSVEVNRTVRPLKVALDPYFDRQWALRVIDVPAAWDVATGDAGVTVAIIDTGIDFSHPDLNDPSLWVAGRDFVNDHPEGIAYAFNPGDTARAGVHGTQVAGIIGALANNGEGGSGVAWQVRMMPVRVFDERDTEAKTDEETVARAVRWAVDHGADIVNLSLGSACKPSRDKCPRPAPILSDALDDAWARGVVVVAAAGNTGGPVLSPANHDRVIAVGSVDPLLQRASYSNFGPELNLMAPGGAAVNEDWRRGCDATIFAPSKQGGYSCAIGTSFAAPHVAGVAALMLSSGAASDPDEVRHLLELTAIDLADPGYDVETGWGLVNAANAIAMRLPSVFVADKGERLLRVVGETTRAGSGGAFRVRGVPEGMWTLVAWADLNGDGIVSAGDLYGEYPAPVHVAKGAQLAGFTVALAIYDGVDMHLE